MIALGCDHGGFDLMQEVMAHLDQRGIEYKNFGTFVKESVIIRSMQDWWQML